MTHRAPTHDVLPAARSSIDVSEEFAEAELDAGSSELVDLLVDVVDFGASVFDALALDSGPER